MIQDKKNKSNFFTVAILSVIIILFAGFVSATQSAVNLGTAGNFVILSKSGISTTGTTLITGDIGASPIDSTAITGFGLIMDSSNQFATSSLVTGKIYSADYTSPTNTKMTTAVSDMETAYTDAAGRTETNIITELGAGDISGMTLTPGLYKWGTGILINNGVTLNCQGNSNSVFIFQIAQDLTLGNGAIITLTNGCQAKNIFWQVGGQATLGTTSVFNGNILSQTLIEINTGAVLNGRALAQTAVTLDSNVITSPGTASSAEPIILSNDEDNSNSDNSDDSSNSNSENLGANVITNQESGNIINVTNSKGIISIVAGVSVTKTKDGETIKITSIDGKTRLQSGNIQIETELPVEVEGNIIRITQSNGAKSEIKIMPITASETAIARLGIKVCNETNNCTIVLKEVGVGKDTKVVYQLKAQKDVKIFGLFKAKMNVEANVDAETGNIISEHKPWWAFLAKEKSK